MSRTITALTVAATTAAITLTGVAPAAAAPVQRVYKHSSDVETTKGPDVKHRADIVYRFNWRPKTAPYRHWVKATSLLYDYNVLHRDSQLCGILDPFEGVTVRLYITQPVTGKNWSSAKWKLPCYKDTTGNIIKGLSHVPRFYMRGCTAPRWKLVVVTNLSMGITDDHAALSGRLFGEREAAACYSARR